MNEFGLMAGKDCIARVDSRKIAEAFEKQHYNVLRDIERLIAPDSGLSSEFTALNFEFSKYVDPTGRKLPCYHLTRDGFTMLVMGYTGEKAMRFKEQYIKLFNEMEQQILTLQSLRDQHPLLTAAIKDTREETKPYDFSNEADMINRIVLGMTAKQYREVNGIPKSEAIRPHLSAEDAALMERLQTMDIGFQYSEPDYQKRKQMLEWYAMRWRLKKRDFMQSPYNDDVSSDNDNTDSDSDSAA
jgi:Rha family phage regulatory protein